MEEEASLVGMRGLALPAMDMAPGVALSAAEAAHTRAVRRRWASFGDGSGAGGEGVGEMEEGEEEGEAALRASAPVRNGTDSSVGAYAALTQRMQGLGVLVLDARAGACRLLAERMGLQLGGVRVFHASGQAAGATKGSAVEVPHANLTAAAAVPHLRAIFKRILAQ